MKKEYIAPYVTKMSCLLVQPILATSMLISDKEGSEQWSNRFDDDSDFEWEE